MLRNQHRRKEDGSLATKIRFTRIGNNLKKSIHKSVALKTVESRYNKFKDARKQVYQKHGEYMESVMEQRDDEEE